MVVTAPATRETNALAPVDAHAFPLSRHAALGLAA